MAFGAEDMGGNLGVSELDSRPDSPSPKDEVHPPSLPFVSSPFHGVEALCISVLIF